MGSPLRGLQSLNAGHKARDSLRLRLDEGVKLLHPAPKLGDDRQRVKHLRGNLPLFRYCILLPRYRTRDVRR